jgi:transketolase
MSHLTQQNWQRASSPLTDAQEKKLKGKAAEMRTEIINMLAAAGSGHAAGSLGMADIFAALYFHLLQHRPKQPEWPDRDRLILSNGHICPARYAAMALTGYFPKKWLLTLRKFGSPLQGHPDRLRLPGVETTSGPLGSGSSIAVGLAYAAKMDQAPWRVYCLMSDAEMQCGQTWEALLFAGKNHLNNCTFVVDRNNIQIDGTTEEIMPLEPLQQKLEAFNLRVEQCHGNNIRSFVEAVARAQQDADRATVIIANTVPGCGVDFMENKFEWHGRVPHQGQEQQAALAQIKIAADRIKKYE